MTFTDDYYKEWELKLKLLNLLDTSDCNNYIKTQIQYLINRLPELQSCISIDLDNETDIIETLDLFGTFEHGTRVLTSFIDYICDNENQFIITSQDFIKKLNVGYKLLRFDINYFSLLDICYLISEDVINLFNKEQKYNLFDLTPLLSLEEINNYKSKIKSITYNSSILYNWKTILILINIVLNSKVKEILEYLNNLYRKAYLP